MFVSKASLSLSQETMRFIEDKLNLLRFLRVLDPEDSSPRDNVRLAENSGSCRAGPLDRRCGNLGLSVPR